MAKRKNRRTTKKPLIANKKYKDTVFRMLFSDRKNLLSLYIAGEYQKLVDHKSLYSSALQKIPAPNFIVFYNGTEKKKERWENLLSEAYENQTAEPNLELRVITLNINEGHNREFMEQCQILREYAQYVAKVRNYTKEMELYAAVKHAVNECIHEGILAEFLRMNRAEVIAMSIFEYDKEEEEKKLRKAEFEAGVAEGIEQGEMRKANEIALMLQEMGLSIEEIAHAVNVNKETIRKWLELQEVAD